jgi:hypothetical protein
MMSLTALMFLLFNTLYPNPAPLGHLPAPCSVEVNGTVHSLYSGQLGYVGNFAAYTCQNGRLVIEVQPS